MLKRAMQEAGFDSDRLTAHSLRHSTGGAVMKLTGNNIYLTQQYMRHSDPATTERYLDNDKAAQDDSLARELYDSIHGQRKENEARQRLAAILDRMNGEQLEHLAGVAAAMAG